MRALHPLTVEEQALAETEHYIVLDFLHRKNLDEAEYYDVVVFGFLTAVQQFIRNPPAGVEFEAAACQAMKDALGKEALYRSRQKRTASVLSLDCPIDGTNVADLYGAIPDERHDTAEQAQHRAVISEALKVATSREWAVLRLVAKGFRPSEAARHLRITETCANDRLHRFRRRARAAIG